MQINRQVIGHRGASGYAPENTFAAFDKALYLGCNFLEFDVMLSADGEPFVFHDDSLKRTTNGRGEVGLMNSTYLQSLDAGKWFSKQYTGEKIPHFKEVLQWLVFVNMNANIEIKPYPNTAQQTAIAVMRHLNRYWPTTKPLPLISSFNLEVLDLCRSLVPELPIGLLIHTWDEDWRVQAQNLQCYSLHINKREITTRRIQAIKEQGYQLFVYTVNSKRQAKKLLAQGVDAIFSDYPDLLS